MKRDTAGSRIPFPALALWAYVALLLYGSLYPLTDWRDPGAPTLERILAHGLRGSWSDVVTNVLVYLPLGGLVAWRRRASGRTALIPVILLAAAAGLALSLAVESAQAWLPARVPSILDVVLNTGGAALGAAIFGLAGEQFLDRSRLGSIVGQSLQPGPVARLGVVAVGCFALAQLAPFVPSLDVGELRHGLHPFRAALQRGGLDWWRLAYYAGALTGLGLMTTRILRPQFAVRRLFLLGAGAVLLLKVPMASRQLSPEALAGLGIAALALRGTRHWGTRHFGRRAVLVPAIAGIVVAIVAEETSFVPGAPLRGFNWLPLLGHLTNPLIGLENLLGAAWPFIALACLAMLWRGRASVVAGFAGAALVFAVMFWLEWRQQLLPGRYGDVTDAVIASAAWLVSFLWVAAGRANQRHFPASDARTGGPGRPVDGRTDSVL